MLDKASNRVQPDASHTGHSRHAQHVKHSPRCDAGKLKVAAPQQLTFDGFPVEVIVPPAEQPMAVYDWEDHSIRTKIIRGECWWVGSDVCRATGHKNSRDALSRLDDEDRMTVANPDSHSGQRGGAQSYVLINESGLYNLIFSSRKPEAQRFKRWVTSEVLPSIRRTGSYSVPGNPRVAKTAKRIKADMITARKRCDVADLNKEAAARLASEGATRRDFAAYHDGRCRGMFDGLNTREVREKLGLKSYQTPLDRMSALLLAQVEHATILCEKKIRESETPIPFDEQARIHAQAAIEMREADVKRLGANYAIGVVDDPQRVKVLDIVRVQLP